MTEKMRRMETKRGGDDEDGKEIRAMRNKGRRRKGKGFCVETMFDKTISPQGPFKISSGAFE